MSWLVLAKRRTASHLLLIGVASVKFARYTLPLFPPLLLWARAYETIRSKGYVTLLGRQEHA